MGRWSVGSRQSKSKCCEQQRDQRTAPPAASSSNQITAINSSRRCRERAPPGTLSINGPWHGTSTTSGHQHTNTNMTCLVHSATGLASRTLAPSPCPTAWPHRAPIESRAIGPRRGHHACSRRSLAVLLFASHPIPSSGSHSVQSHASSALPLAPFLAQLPSPPPGCIRKSGMGACVHGPKVDASSVCHHCPSRLQLPALLRCHRANPVPPHPAPNFNTNARYPRFHLDSPININVVVVALELCQLRRDYALPQPYALPCLGSTQCRRRAAEPLRRLA